jgi:MFS family permease
MKINFKRIRKGTVFILILGIVSLFADFTYEGARSIIPQFFTSTLGGSVFLLGIVLGLSEFAGYAFRLVSGRLADGTRRYWTMMFIGYAINLFAVPLLALSGNYLVAAVLIFMERIGKGTRAPPKDYIISMAASKGKTGRAFAINEALDQTGAILGPIVVSLALFFRGGYRDAFGLLAVPALLAMAFLFVAYGYYGRNKLQRKRQENSRPMTFRSFLIYSVAVAISAAGLYQVSFILYGAQYMISTYLVPLIFLVAMAGEGAFGTIFGLMYDKAGRRLVYIGLLLPLLIPLLLLGGTFFLFIAALIFGAAIGVQDTVMRAVIGSMIHEKKRGSAYGIFNAFYGFGLMISGVVIGYLYYSITDIMVYVAIAQATAFLMLYVSFRMSDMESNAAVAVSAS